MEEAYRLIEEIVGKRLSGIKAGDKVKTLDFVNAVIGELSKSINMSKEDEVRYRPMVVDVLWELQRKGIVRFTDDLLFFEKAQ